MGKGFVVSFKEMKDSVIGWDVEIEIGRDIAEDFFQHDYTTCRLIIK